MKFALKIAQGFNQKAEPFFPLLMFLNLVAFGAAMTVKAGLLVWKYFHG